MPTKLVISGVTGRMGQALLHLLGDQHEFQVAGGIASRRQREPLITETPAAAHELIAQADVIIDFSSMEALHKLITLQGEQLARKALVVGTTGLSADVQRLLADLATRSAVLVAANFSIGVNLLVALVEAAARVLPAADYDAEIVEAHHRRKVDAPSGTALALGRAIAEGRGESLASLRQDGRSGQTGARPAGEIGFHALRGGDIVGEHHVFFIGGRERIEFAHSAQDRSLFAEGALRAAQWMAGKPPGSYTMKDVLGLGSLE